jgi:hypothetical protein
MQAPDAQGLEQKIDELLERLQRKNRTDGVVPTRVDAVAAERAELEHLRAKILERSAELERMIAAATRARAEP